jgi:two-component system LytT family sensor kinase
MKLLFSAKYYLYSLLGFLVFILFTLTLIKISYRSASIPSDTYKSLVCYFLIEGILCALFAWILSFPILYCYEKFIDFGNLSKLNIWKVVLVFCISNFIYSLLIWPVLGVFYRALLHKEFEHLSTAKFVNIPYFATMFLIWIFVVTAFKLYHYINQVKINQLQLESNLRESQLNTLKGQINPHFMFNSLNNIRGLILEDAMRARDIITRLSEMLRYSLSKNGVNTISIKEELQTVDNYIEISKIQFEERLQFYMEVNPKVLPIAIPPMVIQMLVENAVKHGIGNLKQGGEIYVNIDKSDSQLFITVKNSGTLSMGEGNTKLGLENIKQRLSLLFGAHAAFVLEENDTFVEAKIIIPLA